MKALIFLGWIVLVLGIFLSVSFIMGDDFLSVSSREGVFFENSFVNHECILLGSEELCFGGLSYEGGVDDGVLSVIREGFVNTLSFRGENYELGYGESIVFDNFNITYLPVGDVSVEDGVRGSDYYDRILLNFEPDSVSYRVVDVESSRLGDDVRLIFEVDNNLFDGIEVVFEGKVTDYGFFSQRVVSDREVFDLGVNAYDFVISNEVIGSKSLSFVKTFDFGDGKLVSFESSNNARFETGSDGITRFIDESAGDVVDTVQTDGFNILLWTFLVLGFLIVIGLFLYFGGRK